MMPYTEKQDNTISKTKLSPVDIDTGKKLEQAYLDDSMKALGIIDTQNFPQDIPEKEICEILDGLFSKKQLPSRQVKYCIATPNEILHITDYFTEYTYNGRKFVRYLSLVDTPNSMTLSNNTAIEKYKFYWIEVTPIVLSKDKILYSGINTPKR